MSIDARAGRKIAVLCVFVMLFGVGLFYVRDIGKTLAEQEEALRAYQADHEILVFAIAFLVYVAVTGLSLPGAAVMSLVIGWYFGFVRGVVLVSLASTTGATIAFLLSRYLFRDAIQSRFGKQLASFNEALEREGAFYLFTLRLIAGVPFFVINAVMGLTPLRVRTFWWVSQVGMLPGTCVFILAGSQISLRQIAENGAAGILRWQLIVAFALLGIMPLILKKLVSHFRKPQPQEQP